MVSCKTVKTTYNCILIDKSRCVILNGKFSPRVFATVGKEIIYTQAKHTIRLTKFSQCNRPAHTDLQPVLTVTFRASPPKTNARCIIICTLKVLLKCGPLVSSVECLTIRPQNRLREAPTFQTKKKEVLVGKTKHVFFFLNLASCAFSYTKY